MSALELRQQKGLEIAFQPLTKDPHFSAYRFLFWEMYRCSFFFSG